MGAFADHRTRGQRQNERQTAKTHPEIARSPRPVAYLAIILSEEPRRQRRVTNVQRVIVAGRSGLLRLTGGEEAASGPVGLERLFAQ